MPKVVEEVSVRYDSSDFRSLAWNCSSCRNRLLFFLFLPLLAVVVDEFVLSEGGGLDVRTIIASLVLGLLLVAVLFFLLPLFQVRAQRKAGFVTPYRFSFDVEGVHVRHPRQDNLFRWTAMHHVAATEERLFLFLTPGCALILPKRCFPDASQFKRWVDSSKQRWAEARATSGDE